MGAHEMTAAQLDHRQLAAAVDAKGLGPGRGASLGRNDGGVSLERPEASAFGSLFRPIQTRGPPFASNLFDEAAASMPAKLEPILCQQP